MIKKFNDEKNKDLDQGWAWVILFAATGTTTLTGIFLYCVGILNVALLENFNENNAYTSLIGSAFTGLLCLMGPCSSVVVNKFSCRTAVIAGGIAIFLGFTCSFFTDNINVLLFTLGIIAGTGLGLSTIPAIVVIGYFFHKKHGLASGIVMSGCSLGMFVAGPLIQSLIDTYGLHGSFLILAAIGSNIIILGSLMRPSNLEFKHKTDNNLTRSVTDKINKNKDLISKVKYFINADILCNTSFMCCCLQFSLWNMGLSIVLMHLPTFSITQGSDFESSALLITYLGIGSTLGRFLTGLAIGRNSLDPIMLNFGLNTISGVLTCLFSLWSHHSQGRVIFAILFGLYSGGLSTMINPLCMEILGVAKVSSGVGILFFIGGIGYLSGPPISAFIIDHGGGYKDSLYLCGCVFLGAAIFTLLTSAFRVPEDMTETIVTSEHSNGQVLIISTGNLLHIQSTSMKTEDKSLDILLDAETKDDIKVNEQTPLTLDNN